MKFFTKHFKVLLAISILIMIAGCQRIEVRGQFISAEAINEINAKQLNKDQLIGMIGNPTYVPDYTENTWYYIQRSMSKTAWFDPKVVKQRIVKIVFSGKKSVAKAELLKNIHNEKITVLDSYTKTRGTERTGIQKFVKNIGRFNKSADKKSKKNKQKKK